MLSRKRYFANFQKKKIINFNNLFDLTQKYNFTNTVCHNNHNNEIITTKTENAKLRILGVAKSPKSLIPPKKLELSERFSNIFSAEKNKEKREELLKKYKTSYWKDFNELRANGEKLWEADTELVNAEKALYMPNIKARTLNRPIIDTTDLLEGHVSLVSIVFNQFGENHTKTFINPFLQEFFNHDKIQLIQVNIEMNFAKSLLLRLLIPYIKRTIPVSQHVCLF
ncbi:11087_t:CDS:2 [Diversispora eburnea]|uniref:11087_t:CDS:1 n=1 Tax=Diversispora eburnea TaxID=1213867 RepID=A0A9N8YU04_9GLOM|nr:11087_t:CDS:2 [Diversispora eburnea]